MSGSPVFSLSAYADYACRHSGACCTAGWSIPVEPHLSQRLGTTWLLPVNGACPEYDTDARRCRIHRAHGEAMLPVSCFHFPRRALIDERGTFVTLSHFCPTAATLLLDAPRPLHVVANPRAFPRERAYEGLDARGEWPPLLRPDVLFDYPSYDLWERFLVQALSGTQESAEVALARIAATAEHLRAWTPARGPLLAWTEQVLGEEHRPEWPACYQPLTHRTADALARSSVPHGLDVSPPPLDVGSLDERWVASPWSTLAPFIGRYLAARAFASWSAYDGHGVRTQVAELLVSAAVLRTECARACAETGRPLDRGRLHAAVRASDWLLVHLADRLTLMTELRIVEHHAPARRI